MRSLTAALALLALVAGAHAQEIRPRPTEWAQPMIGTPLDNFHRVDERLYRSAQPDDEEMEEIEGLGIQSVLNLRNHHTDDDEAEGTDLTLHHIATEADDITAEQIEEALRIIRDSEGPVLVHCWHGSDRTGVVVASYRMVFQDWTADAAWDEALNGGYGLHSIYEDHLREVLVGLDVEGMRERLDLPSEQEHGDLP